MDYLEEIKREFPKVKPFKEHDWTWEKEGYTFLKKRKFEEAEHMFKKLCLSQPNKHGGFEGLAYTYYLEDQKVKAEWFMNEAIRRARQFMKDNSMDQTAIDEMEDNLSKIINGGKFNTWWY